ncbi:hypothetical protein PAPYR_2284 [Paratrimastix pyriformis]|uniref:Uncharacterized protein n=1 Tax=Paratrimastix pyriformis TaxID=342808 RepID=A0ABQ8USD0_9EUKA|nr:hypothetical protein PAPYR_2284 [Paratrimastix pyriformis]
MQTGGKEDSVPATPSSCIISSPPPAYIYGRSYSIITLSHSLYYGTNPEMTIDTGSASTVAVLRGASGIGKSTVSLAVGYLAQRHQLYRGGIYHCSLAGVSTEPQLWSMLGVVLGMGPDNTTESIFRSALALRFPKPLSAPELATRRKERKQFLDMSAVPQPPTGEDDAMPPESPAGSPIPSPAPPDDEAPSGAVVAAEGRWSDFLLIVDQCAQCPLFTAETTGPAVMSRVADAFRGLRYERPDEAQPRADRSPLRAPAELTFPRPHAPDQVEQYEEQRIARWMQEAAQPAQSAQGLNEEEEEEEREGVDETITAPVFTDPSGWAPAPFTGARLLLVTAEAASIDGPGVTVHTLGPLSGCASARALRAAFAVPAAAARHSRGPGPRADGSHPGRHRPLRGATGRQPPSPAGPACPTRRHAGPLRGPSRRPERRCLAARHGVASVEQLAQHLRLRTGTAEDCVAELCLEAILEGRMPVGPAPPRPVSPGSPHGRPPCDAAGPFGGALARRLLGLLATLPAGCMYPDMVALLGKPRPFVPAPRRKARKSHPRRTSAAGGTSAYLAPWHLLLDALAAGGLVSLAATQASARPAVPPPSDEPQPPQPQLHGPLLFAQQAEGVDESIHLAGNGVFLRAARRLAGSEARLEWLKHYAALVVTMNQDATLAPATSTSTSIFGMRYFEPNLFPLLRLEPALAARLAAYHASPPEADQAQLAPLAEGGRILGQAAVDGDVGVAQSVARRTLEWRPEGTLGMWTGWTDAIEEKVCVTTIATHYGAALQHLERCADGLVLAHCGLDAAMQAHDMHGEATLRVLLGNLHTRMGTFPRARAFFERALALFRLCGIPVAVASTLCLLAELAHKQGKMLEAASNYDGALTIFRDQKMPLAEAQILKARLPLPPPLASLTHGTGM